MIILVILGIIYLVGLLITFVLLIPTWIKNDVYIKILLRTLVTAVLWPLTWSIAIQLYINQNRSRKS